VSAVVSLTLRALRTNGGGALPGYGRALRAACVAAPPPFGAAWYGEHYRALAIDPRWLAASLIDNATREGEGSVKLWRLAGRVAAPEVAEQIRRHAVDESRHALVYVAMLETVFPGAVSGRVRHALIGLSPRYRAHERPRRQRAVSRARVLDELIQMNLGEIRTRINQLLLAPMIAAFCPRSRRRRLRRMLNALMRDEIRHIAYTAHLIEAAIGRGDGLFVHRAMARRLTAFNRLTVEEVGGSAHEA
jgi:hypothetical protein